LPGNQPYPSLPIYIPPSSGSGGGGGGQPSQPVNEPPTDSPYWQNVFIPGVGWVWAIIPPQNAGGGEGGGEGGGDKPEMNPLPSR